jgi:serine/threonine protein kinase
MAEAATPRKRIAHYEILDRLGEGGMGVVWKARDTRLNRLAAIKVLPPDRITDEERKRRFVQEAQTASALNHANIITIYDINTEAGVDYIAMEYVAGRTLDQSIPRGGLRLNDALKYAIQIADALAAAHKAGIVHRDLKPSNVMIAESGAAKLLDFGLAKLMERQSVGEPDVTLTAAESSEGLIVGTVAYMSPEQAQAKPVDRRSDIFAFGLVLYEMVTGRRAFQGDTNISTLADILNREPAPASQLAPGVPRELDRILSRCLKKDPARRFQDADDLKIALEELKEESESGALAPGGAPIRPPSRRRWFAAVAALAIGALAGVWTIRTQFSPAPPPRVVPLTSFAGLESHASFSPDGSQVAFSWNGEKQDNTDIYVTLVEGGGTLRLTNAVGPDVHPSWSPDGRWIAYYRMGSVYLVSPLGGQERRVCEGVGGIMPSVAWTPDSQSLIVSAGPGSGTRTLVKVSIGTGQKQPLTSEPAGGVHGQPAVSPDGQYLAFSHYQAHSSQDLYVVGIDGSGLRRITTDYLPIEGLTWTNDSREIVFASVREGGGLWRVAARSGAQPERIAGADRGARYPAISRNSRGPARLAFSDLRQDENIWIGDLVREKPVAAPKLGAVTRFPGSNQTDYAGEFSPSGERIAFSSNRTGNFEIWVAGVDGSRQTQLTFFRGGDVNHARWSPDGAKLAFGAMVQGNRDIYVISSQGPSAPQRMTFEPSDEGRPRWSHDGKWIYFRSNRSGQNEIWKMPAGGGPAVQLTKTGAQDSAESRDGTTLYYDGRGSLWSMPAQGGEPSRIGNASTSWGLTLDGIFNVRGRRLAFYSFASRAESEIGHVESPTVYHVQLSMSPDGHRLAWSQTDRLDSDLMVVENFR